MSAACGSTSGQRITALLAANNTPARLRRHRVDKQRKYWLVMTNVLSSKLKIHEKYDLKGSTEGRTASVRETNKGVRTIFKDNDFLTRRCQSEEREGAAAAFSTGASTEMLLEALTKDVAFLQEMNLIDYSLLTGVHEFRPVWTKNYDYAEGDCVYPPSFRKHKLCFRCKTLGKSGDREPTWPLFGDDTATQALGAQLNEGGILWECQPEERHLQSLSHEDAGRLTWAATEHEMLFFGIIDILTEYKLNKKAETFVRGTMRGGKDVSCQPAEKYGDRFLRFCRECILVGNEQAQSAAGASPRDAGGLRTLSGQSTFSRASSRDRRQRRGAINMADEAQFEHQGSTVPLSMKKALMSGAAQPTGSPTESSSRGRFSRRKRGGEEAAAAPAPSAAPAAVAVASLTGSADPGIPHVVAQPMPAAT